jgi:hypothetical protein
MSVGVIEVAVVGILCGVLFGGMFFGLLLRARRSRLGGR